MFASSFSRGGTFYVGKLADVVLGYDTVAEYAVRSRVPLFLLFQISITYTLFIVFLLFSVACLFIG
jgi:hypothetical protein